jgi:hypothetical protein
LIAVPSDWRIWRPAIWLAMLGIAVALVINPWYYSAIFFGAAIGAGIRIEQRRRQAVAAEASRAPAGRQRKRR